MAGAEAGFDAFVGRLDYPMFVVTAGAGEQRAGCLVGFTSQVSISPPRFLVALSKKNRTYRVAAEASHLAVHLLAQRDHALARLFGSETGDDVDKFSRWGWRDGPGGVPLLTDAPAWFVGRILQRHDLGDHVGFLLDPEAAEVRDGDVRLLTLRDVTDLEPGHDA